MPTSQRLISISSINCLQKDEMSTVLYYVITSVLFGQDPVIIRVCLAWCAVLFDLLDRYE
jgi:hypothetical protein